MGIVLGCVFIVMLVFLGYCNSYVAARFFVFHAFPWCQGFKIPSKILQSVIHVRGTFVSPMKYLWIFIQLSGRSFWKKQSHKKRENFSWFYLISAKQAGLLQRSLLCLGISEQRVLGGVPTLMPTQCMVYSPTLKPST